MSNFTSGDLDEQDLKDIAAAAAEHDAAHGTDGNTPLHEQPAVAAPAVAPAVAPAAAPAATPAPAPGPFPSPSAPAQAPAAPAPAPTPAAAPADAPAPAPAAVAQDKPQGDTRAALRASRRSEYRTREENKRLTEELNELKKKVGVTTEGALPAEVMKDVETYAPEAAKHIKQLEERIAAAPAPAAARTDFTPMYFEPEVQDLIDDIPQLAAWHANPDQTAFNLARRADALLQNSPAWEDKPDSERLAEAVRIAQQQMGATRAPAPSPTDPAAVAAAAIAAAPVVQPAPSIGGMGTGTQPQPLKPDYSKMTDEEILALPE